MAEEKTEEPTPRRLQKAREEGDSGASAFAAQAVAFLVAVAVVPSAVVATAKRCSGWLFLAIARAGERPVRARVDPGALAGEVAALVGPVLIAAAVAAAAVALVQTGGVVAWKRLEPDLGKLDPVAGTKRLVSRERIFAVLRSLVTAALVAYLGYRQLGGHALDLAHTAGRAAWAGALGGNLAARVARDTAIVGIAVAALDAFVVRWSWKRRLKMSPDEIKREHKESEGDPQVKAARERMRREVLAQATVAAVKDASVVVVNPTHLATALRYVEDDDGAPVVIASGEGDLAARIVRAARDYGVPVVRDVPLARALRELEIGDVIPEALYEAVAEILRAAWEEGDRDHAGP